MLRSLIVVPGLVGQAGEPSATASLPNLAALAADGDVQWLRPESPGGLPEAGWMGLNPENHAAADGPLLVAGLGERPPDRSVCLVATWATMGTSLSPAPRMDAAELAEATAAIRRLETPRLVWIEGEQPHNALVWLDGPIDFSTTPVEHAFGHGYQTKWPTGDGERTLRLFIEDAHDLLTSLDFNRRRLDAGIAPVDVVWPWGQGWMPRMPNLALRYPPATVHTDSLRVRGVCRLTGLTSRRALERGMGDNWRFVKGLGPTSLIILESFATLRREGRLEELQWLARRMDANLFDLFRPIRPAAGSHLVILSPSDTGPGLMLERSADSRGGSTPFDERALEDAGPSGPATWDVVARVMRSWTS